jgi:hypothetical protein
VLEKTEKGYKINQDWFKRIREFAEAIDKNSFR